MVTGPVDDRQHPVGCWLTILGTGRHVCPIHKCGFTIPDVDGWERIAIWHERAAHNLGQ